MRIEILVPVATDFRNNDILAEAKKSKQSNIDIVVKNIKYGPVSLESNYDDALVMKHVVEMAEEMEKSGADAIVLFCFNEPALDACKEKLNIPVIGLREAPIAIASTLGDAIGVIVPSENSKRGVARALGDKVKHVISLNLPILEFEDLNRLQEAIEIKIQQLIQLGCDVAVFGCGSILGLDVSRIQEKYNIPVVEPIHAAMAFANHHVLHKILHSKIAYPNPSQKDIL